MDVCSEDISLSPRLRSMLRLHIFNTGWLTIQEKHLYVGGKDAIRTLPVLSFVIEHPQGVVVFDTGLNAAFATQPRQYVGWLSDRLIPFRSSPGLNLAAQMQVRGLSPADVSHVVLSHLHYDHTGDLRAFPQARRLLARQEWEAAQSPFRRLHGYLAKEYAGLAFTLLDFPAYSGPLLGGTSHNGYGLDLMGDGSLIVVPTFGHTCGHLSLLAFLPYGIVLLAADAVYVRENYTRPAAQPYAHFPGAAWRTIVGLRALAKGAPSVLIVLSHDDSTLQNIDRPDIVIGDLHIPCQVPGRAGVR